MAKFNAIRNKRHVQADAAAQPPQKKIKLNNIAPPQAFMKRRHLPNVGGVQPMLHHKHPRQSPQNRFADNKKSLAQNFSRINIEMARRTAFEDAEGENTFLDIFRVAPVIDLAEAGEDDEEFYSISEAGSLELEDVEEEEEEMDENGDGILDGAEIPLVELSEEEDGNDDDEEQPADPTQPSTSAAFVPAAAMPKKKKKKAKKQKSNQLKMEPVTSGESLNQQKPLLSSSFFSDVDMREKPVDIAKIRAKNSQFVQDAPANVQSDLDLRNQLPNLQQVSKMASSSNSAAEEEFPCVTNPEETIISRVRFAHRTPLIDLSLRYELVGLRYFQDIPGNLLETPDYKPVPLGIVSFNVLCQRSMEKTLHLYRHLGFCDYRHNTRKFHGLWEGRRQKLQSEFDRLNRMAADVFCLQEVQDVHYESFYFPYFTQVGYNAMYTPRGGADMPDGCAIFWRPNKLELLETQEVHYNLGVEGMNRPNVGQIALFGVQGHRTAICITNTHIYYNMKRGEVKLAQIAFLLSSMHKIQTEFQAGQGEQHQKYSHFAGHILCGDFNMYPNSPLHRFLIDRQIDLRVERFGLALAQNSQIVQPQGPNQEQRLMNNYFGAGPSLPRPLALPFKRMGIAGDCTFVTQPTLSTSTALSELKHGFKFASVYEHWNVAGQPEISNYHSAEHVHPDFIFYMVTEQRELVHDAAMSPEQHLVQNTESRELCHENFIHLRKRLSLPTLEQFDQAGGPIPNEQYGSDHLSLFAGFDVLCLPEKTLQQQTMNK